MQKVNNLCLIERFSFEGVEFNYVDFIEVLKEYERHDNS